MDSKILEEMIICGICFEVFNEDSRCPRMPPCGHTFCHSCLEKILEQNPLCPTCKTQIHQQKAELIPINFAVKGLIPVVKSSKEILDNLLPSKSGNSLRLKSEGFCIEHSSNKELRCMDCESWICAMCGVFNHKQCKVLLVEDAYKEMNIHVTYQKIGNELESRKEINAALFQSLEILEEEMEELNKVSEKKVFDIKICEKRINQLSFFKSEDEEFFETLPQDRKAAEKASTKYKVSFALTLLEDLIVKNKMLSSHLETLYDDWPWSIPNAFEDLRLLCNNDLPVYAVNKEKNLFGEVKLNNRQTWISSFHPQIAEGHFIPFEKLLLRARGSSDLPNKAFLKLASKGRIYEEMDLVIETDGTSPRAKNFILLCAALEGRMYKGMTLELQDSSFYELNPGPPPVVSGIINEKYASTTWEDGFIVGTCEGMSGFYIALEGDYAEYSLTKIGVVVSGLKKLKQFGEKKLLIKESGLVI